MVMPDEAPFASAAACCLYKTQCAMARKPDIPDAHWPGMPQSLPAMHPGVRHASFASIRPRSGRCLPRPAAGHAGEACLAPT